MSTYYDNFAMIHYIPIAIFRSAREARSSSIRPEIAEQGRVRRGFLSPLAGLWRRMKLFIPGAETLPFGYGAV